MRVRKPLPTPEEIKREFPLLPKEEAFLALAKEKAKLIVEHKSPLFTLVVGPCSVHDADSTIEYALKIQKLSREVADSIFLVMRLFVEKPRTQLGWKGILYDPHLDGTNDIAEGLRQSRKLLLTMAHLGVPCASELLDPLASSYFSDLVAWGFVGARTSASPLHRQMASGLPFPVGFKNSLHGETDVAIAAILAARASHSHLGINEEGKISCLETPGNRWTHIVLRGSQTKSNFDPASIAKTIQDLKKHRISPRLLIDCAHGNSRKNPLQQKTVLKSVLQQIKEGNEAIFGVMLESHLYAGKQPLIDDPDKLHYGVSITDPCLGWEETEDLVREVYQELSGCNSISSLQK